MVLIQTTLLIFLFGNTFARWPTTKKINRVHHNSRVDMIEAPFQTIVVYKNHYCSGSLISSRAILTAAHCVNTNNSQEIFVKTGSDTLTGDGDIIKCLDVKIHEYYGVRNTIDNDIALVFLEGHVHYNIFTKKITLYRASELPLNKAKLIVTGYGYTIDGQSDLIKLIYGQIEIIPFSHCKDQYGLLPTHSKFCAEYKSDTCMTDSACPATVDDMLLGIAVIGTSCTEVGMPMIFINVSHYHNWVYVNLFRLLQKYCTINKHKNMYEDEFGE